MTNQLDQNRRQQPFWSAPICGGCLNVSFFNSAFTFSAQTYLTRVLQQHGPQLLEDLFQALARLAAHFSVQLGLQLVGVLFDLISGLATFVALGVHQED